MANLNDVLKAIERVSGKGAIMRGVEVKDVERISLPMALVNRSLYGGIPKGRMIEFSGGEASGKTTTSLMVSSAYQVQDERPVFFIDAEGTYDPRWANLLGVDNSKLIKWTPENMTAEEVFQKILEVAETGEVGLIILDSIPALVPQQVDAKNMTEYQMGGISSALTKFTQKLQKILLSKSDVVFIGINQVRDNMSQYGPPTTTPGGRGWKHLTSIRIEFRSENVDKNGSYLSDGAENPAGVKIIANLKKNKTAPRNRNLSYYIIDFEDGFNEKMDVVSLAISLGIVKQAGAWFSYNNNETGELLYKAQGKGSFVKELSEELFLQIKKEVNEIDN